MEIINEKYCVDCGNKINAKAEICPKCGVRQMPPPGNDSENRWLISLLLCWFVGVFGVHRFYNGHTGTGLLQLFTLGGCGIWALIDLIMIITGSFKDAEGNYIKQR
ncbi:NINE protein [Bacteroidota bacterium]